MSNEIGLPTRHARNAVTSKGVLLTAVGVAATAAIGAAFALAVPFAASGAGVPASSVSAQTPMGSGSARLTAAGLDALLNARFAPVNAAVVQQGSAASQQVTAMLTGGSGQPSSDGNMVTLDVPAVGGTWAARLRQHSRPSTPKWGSSAARMASWRTP